MALARIIAPQGLMNTELKSRAVKEVARVLKAALVLARRKTIPVSSQCASKSTMGSGESARRFPHFFNCSTISAVTSRSRDSLKCVLNILRSAETTQAPQHSAPDRPNEIDRLNCSLGRGQAHRCSARTKIACRLIFSIVSKGELMPYLHPDSPNSGGSFSQSRRPNFAGPSLERDRYSICF
jgi:hypothetical protein